MTSKHNQLTLLRPDDWHVHFRDGDILDTVVDFTARQFSRAIVMPNLTPPVTDVDNARNYRNRIMDAISDHYNFEPLMTCYLTDEINFEEIEKGFREGVFFAVKLYPSGVTTNSALGVSDITRLYGVFEKMSVVGIPLLVHGETPDPAIDIFDREAFFIDQVLEPLVREFRALKVVIEHITTKEGVDFVRSQGERVAATITAHHLVINRSDLFKGGIRPHLYCLPIAKREHHRLALREAATSGHQSFFLGTDTAPHPRNLKESACGCAGIFSAPAALEIYAQVFDEENALENLEFFASINGARFYNLPLNQSSITLKRQPNIVPQYIECSDRSVLIPFLAGESLNWKILE